MTCEMELVYSYMFFVYFFFLPFSVYHICPFYSFFRYLRLACFEIFGLLRYITSSLFCLFLPDRSNCILEFVSFAPVFTCQIIYSWYGLCWE